MGARKRSPDVCGVQRLPWYIGVRASGEGVLKKQYQGSCELSSALPRGCLPYLLGAHIGESAELGSGVASAV